MLLLDSKPMRRKTRARFIFDSKWTKMQEYEEMIAEEWNKPVSRSRMFKEQQKWCKLRFIKWRKEMGEKARKELDLIQKEMEAIQKMERTRDWEKWKLLKTSLNEAYESKEAYESELVKKGD